MDKRVLLEKVPFFLISVIYAADTLYMHEQTGQLDHAQLASPFDNFLLACRNIVLYIKNTVWPIELSAIYPTPKEVSVLLPEFFLPLLILAIMVALLFWTRRYTRTIIFGYLFFLVAILPVVKLVPFASGGSIISDRYMYHSSIGLFFIVAFFIDKLYKMEGDYRDYYKVASVVIVGIAVLLLSSMTHQRNKVWQNSEVLWSDVVKKYPNVSNAHSNLAHTYYNSGRLDEAIMEYKEAIKLSKHYPKARYNLGLAYAYSGQYDKAIEEFQNTISMDPDHVDAHMSLGRVYQHLGLIDKAIEEYREVLRVEPDRTDIYNNIVELSLQ
jgi:tetratricopeptide (TPR) repeat protein